MNKRRILFGMLIALTLVLSSCGNDKEALMDVPVMSDYVQFDYNGLKSEAQIVAKIQVQDDLSAENTELTYDPYETTQKSIIEFLAMRKVKILEIYKGSTAQVGDIMEIIEPAGVTETQLLHDENYKPMAKDGVYILFLSNETASGQYGIISANNGIVDLINPGNSGYLEIEVKAIAEFESDLPKESKDAILQSKIAYAAESDEQYLMESTELSVKDSNGKEIKNYFIKFGTDRTKNITCVKFIQ